MTTFKEIRGTAIQSVSSDPTNPEAGQIWYNNTIGVLKGYKFTTGTWASGGNMVQSFYGRAQAGTQTAGLVFAGRNLGPVTNSGATEEYDGTSWASNPSNMNTARRYLSGCGTQTAALGWAGVNGGNQNATESYNGSTWTNVNSLNTPRGASGGYGFGTQTSAVAAGGVNFGPPTVAGATEEWDGTNWTTVNALPTAREGGGASGILTAGLVFGGPSTAGGGTTSDALEYDGTNWTTTGSLNTARTAGGGGTQTSALAFGGDGSTATEEFNGSTWINGGSLSTAKSFFRGSIGTQALGLSAGANPTPSGAGNITEEYTGPSALAVKKITTS
jgi:hypothetical protein